MSEHREDPSQVKQRPPVPAPIDDLCECPAGAMGAAFFAAGAAFWKLISG